jgi:ABC-2 type transport system ATP-binding protein
MTPAVMRLEGVSKRFRIYRRRHQSLKELLVKRSRGDWEELWALKDVSFEVPRGQTLGVIGENGSGKSTTLKLLAGILQPDGGTVVVQGRLSSLLELGAGFQPEYTGRENVYLYGALLGLRRRDISRHFDEIVDFSGIEPALDYPVKNYSSGMYMRLAFAVAVHLDPEILLIDEVLAVGDAAFQNKCFQRLQRFREEGRTIVLVSHDLESIRRFCERAIWLDHGHIGADGPPDQSIQKYLDVTSARPAARAAEEIQIPGFTHRSGKVAITALRYLDAGGNATRTFSPGEALSIEVGYEAREALANVAIGISFFRNDGVYVTDANTNTDGIRLSLDTGYGRAVLRVPSLSLLAGTYDISVSLYDPSTFDMYDLQERRYPFTVRDIGLGGAVTTIDHRWELDGITGQLRGRRIRAGS